MIFLEAPPVGGGDVVEEVVGLGFGQGVVAFFGSFVAAAAAAGGG